MHSMTIRRIYGEIGWMGWMGMGMELERVAEVAEVEGLSLAGELIKMPFN